MTEIRSIRKSDIEGFRLALDSVCRERKILGAIKAPSEERVIESLSTGTSNAVARSSMNVVSAIFTLSGNVVFSIAITWVTWAVFSDY